MFRGGFMLVVMQALATDEQIRAVCEKIETWVTEPTPCRAPAHRDRHYWEPWGGRARHAGRNAGRAGTHPRQQAVQTGQPRRQG